MAVVRGTSGGCVCGKAPHPALSPLGTTVRGKFDDSGNALGGASPPPSIIPAKAGIPLSFNRFRRQELDPRRRGGDGAVGEFRRRNSESGRPKN